MARSTSYSPQHQSSFTEKLCMPNVPTFTLGCCKLLVQLSLKKTAIQQLKHLAYTNSRGLFESSVLP